MKIEEDFYSKTEKNCFCKEKEISRKTDQRIVLVYKVYEYSVCTNFSFFF